MDHLPALLAAVPTLLNVEVKKFELVAVASVADLAVLVQAVQVNLCQKHLFLNQLTHHSMATANLNKIEDFVTNTTAASKNIPRRPRISIN